MTTKITVLRAVVACLLSSQLTTPVWAGGGVTCIQSISKPRLVCDEGACVRVPIKDLCDAVRASYPVKRRGVKPLTIDVDPVRDELTMLIASVS